MQVRLARDSDIPEVHRIAQALRITGHPHCDWHHLAEIRGVIRKREIFVAIQDGAVIGFTCLRRHKKTSEIVTFAITAKHRKRGVGRAFIRFIARRAMRIGTSRVAVATLSCFKSKDFYTSCGFTLIQKYRWSNMTQYDFRATPRMLLTA